MRKNQKRCTYTFSGIVGSKDGCSSLGFEDDSKEREKERRKRIYREGLNARRKGRLGLERKQGNRPIR